MTRSDVKDISDWAYDAYFATQEVSAAAAQPLIPRRLYNVLEALRGVSGVELPAVLDKIAEQLGQADEVYALEHEDGGSASAALVQAVGELSAAADHARKLNDLLQAAQVSLGPLRCQGPGEEGRSANAAQITISFDPEP